MMIGMQTSATLQMEWLRRAYRDALTMPIVAATMRRLTRYCIADVVKGDEKGQKAGHPKNEIAGAVRLEDRFAHTPYVIPEFAHG